jgi:hypothetical protein
MSDNIACAAAERIVEWLELAISGATLRSDRVPKRVEHISAIAESAKERWLPIATAPKDGTRVLLFNPDEPPYQCVGCWLNNTTGGGWVSSEWDVEPSHWQPLPPPPEEQPNVTPATEG